jgi:hypothetical protein
VKEISFAWTTPALLAGRKTCTRRGWKYGWAMGFMKGELVGALDRQRRFGGKRIALIRIMERPYQESSAATPESDWEAEGFDYLTEIGATVGKLTPKAIWTAWRVFPQELWVVRFKLVEVLEVAA